MQPIRPAMRCIRPQTHSNRIWQCRIRAVVCNHTCASLQKSSSRHISTTRTLSSASQARDSPGKSANLDETSAPGRPATPDRNKTSPPAATSQPATAQPFSTDLLPQRHIAKNLKKEVSENAAAKATRVVSSVPAGTPLKGLNYFRNKEDPLAMEDHEYPDWLWRVLERKEKDGDSGPVIDPRIYSKSENARRKANKRMRENAKNQPGPGEAKIPLCAQTIDLSAGDGSQEGAIEAQKVRTELTQSMRQKRRKHIKESNFLKSMG